METKHCGKCKIEKELNEFCFRIQSKDGRDYSCKECNNEDTGNPSKLASEVHLFGLGRLGIPVKELLENQRGGGAVDLLAQLFLTEAHLGQVLGGLGGGKALILCDELGGSIVTGKQIGRAHV